MKPKDKLIETSPMSPAVRHSRIVSVPDDKRYLDSSGLNRLEHAFRAWVEVTPRQDVRLSGRRILLIFLLIRYTGAKLNEVLTLDPFRDIDYDQHSVIFRDEDSSIGLKSREVQISEAFSTELHSMLADPELKKTIGTCFTVDPGFIRRKFYERAEKCGFSKEMGGPEMIRKSRAVELMQGNMPLPAVQMLLGHSTPNLTSSYVSFSEDEIRQLTKHFVEKESSRKTSARNTFFGKIRKLQRGDIQTLVELYTVEGHQITTVITNDSVGRLGLKEGNMISAEVKAPYVILQKTDREPESSAENRFRGFIGQVTTGKINTEYVVAISEGTNLCSLITTESSRRLNLKKGDPVWALFSSFAVVLHID